VTNNDENYSLVLKFENSNENNLSVIAKQLNLYKREYYFYTNIYNFVSINKPLFYNLTFENDSPNGVILENLLSKKYKNNLNLNVESIDITLRIVSKFAYMHSQFWNKTLKKLFPELKSYDDVEFTPFLGEFIRGRYDSFIKNWTTILNSNQIDKFNKMYENFENCRRSFVDSDHLTFIHGDIKSPNIFYDCNNNCEPYFIDWQHCAIGKGVQDLVFFIIESFDIENLKSIFAVTKIYYYKKLIEYGVVNYSYQEYTNDIYNAICFIPFFTAVWFGTTPQDELLDKNFPYFFIKKLAYLIEIYE